MELTISLTIIIKVFKLGFAPAGSQNQLAAGFCDFKPGTQGLKFQEIIGKRKYYYCIRLTSVTVSNSFEVN